MALSAKQERFVAEYLIDLNATQAAIRTGYSAATAYSQGQRLLKHVEVAAALEVAMAARAERTEVTADRVLRELAKIGFSDIRKAVRWGGASAGDPQTDAAVLSSASFVELVNSEDVDDETAAAISEVSQTAQGLKIKLHDKRAALVDIGKHLGMFTDKVEHSGAVTVVGQALDEAL